MLLILIFMVSTASLTVCGHGAVSADATRGTAAQPETGVATLLVHQRWFPPGGAPLRLTRAFRAPPSPYTAGHRGIDLVVPQDAQIWAPTSGTVTFVGKVVDRGVLSLRVDSHTIVSLEPLISELSVGDAVSRGMALGVHSVGGHCGASCLHVGVRVHDQYVNPMRFFAGSPRLLPW